MRGAQLFRAQVLSPIFLLLFEVGQVTSRSCSSSNNICYCEYSSIYSTENKLRRKCCDDRWNFTYFHIEGFPVRHCSGETRCYGYDSDFDGSPPDLLDKNYLICFSGTQCLSPNGSSPGSNASVQAESCYGSFQSYNITNTVGIWSSYECFALSNVQEAPPCCIQAKCSSFSHLEKKCFCDSSQYSCLCYTGCDLINLNPTYNTRAIFVSFGDYYVTEKKNTAIVILIIMLVVLAMVIVLLSFRRVYWSIMTRESSLITATYLNPRSVRGNRNHGPSGGTLTRELVVNATIEQCIAIDNIGPDDLALPTYYEAVISEINAVELPPNYDTSSSEK